MQDNDSYRFTAMNIPLKFVARALLPISVSCILSACATVSQVASQDGHAHYVAACSGQALSWSDCGAQAKKTCTGGTVNVVSRSDDAKLAGENSGKFFNLDKYDRKMEFTCGP